MQNVDQPQTGIFALGTASHAYLEFAAHDAESADQLVRAVAGLREPRTTMGGINLVAGFRPEIWRGAAPDDAPDAAGFDRDIVGVEGYTMPATQHDALLWLSGSGDRGARTDRNRRGGNVELAVPPRPRPHRLHRRHGEPDAAGCPR